MAKILLVEDDKSLREIYGVRLMAEGYEIVSAGDGEEALAMAIKERPDLIVSDVMMPKISGFDMLDILRSTSETKDVKVIMMTALSSDDQRARGEALGADRYLVKSQVGIEDVVRTVHDVLGDSIAAPAAPTFPPSQPQAVPAPAPAVEPAFATPAPAAAPIFDAPAPVADAFQPTPAPAPEASSEAVISLPQPMEQPTVQPAAQPTAPVYEDPAPTATPAYEVPAPLPAPAPVAEPAQPAPAYEVPAPTAPAPLKQAPVPVVQQFQPAPAPQPVAQPPAQPAQPFAAPGPVSTTLSELPANPTAAQPSQLPQPTAPFSSPAPASLGERIIEPLSSPVASADPNDIASQIQQALSGQLPPNQGNPPVPPAA